MAERPLRDWLDEDVIQEEFAAAEAVLEKARLAALTVARSSQKPPPDAPEGEEDAQTPPEGNGERQVAPISVEKWPGGIIGAPLVMVRPEVATHRGRAGVLFQPAAHLRHGTDGGSTYLPGFGPGEDYGPAQTPALPLALYDLGVRETPRPGPGAPLALRIFVEACLSVPLSHRGSDVPVPLEPMRFRDVLAWAGVNPAHYAPSRHWGKWVTAFAALESPDARVPWEDPATGKGGARRVVQVRDVPRHPAGLDDWVSLAVDLPPGSSRGPLVDRPGLRKTAVATGAAYRLLLSLSFWWHEPGKTRTPASKGSGRRSAKRWLQTRAWSRYRAVPDEMLVAMAFPVGGSEGATYRKRLERARKALAWLVEVGLAGGRGDGARRVIRPGPNWVGWE